MKRLLVIALGISIAAQAHAECFRRCDFHDPPCLVPEVEGYVWPLSVSPGETIDLYVSGTMMPNDPAQPNVTFHRVTSDDSGILFRESSPTAGISITSTGVQPILSEAPDRDGPLWPLSGTFTIPQNWPTGYYVATLKALSGPAADYPITFTVKPSAEARHRTAILSSTNTANAYNGFCGRSKYNGYPVTSFMRPNLAARLQLGEPPSGVGTPIHLMHAEIWLLKAIEDYLGRGRVDVYSDIDFHNGVVQAGTHAGEYDRLILSTHPEYWSIEEYDNLRAFLDRGGSVLYLAGNGVFETMSYSTNVGGPAATFLNGIEDSDRSAALFRSTTPLRAERALLGVATTACDQPNTGTPYVVHPHPPVGSYARGVFDAILDGVVGPNDVDRRIGTMGLRAGASGHEVDRVAEVDGAGYIIDVPCGIAATEPDTTPAGVVRLAEGGLISGEPGADMIYYPYPNPPGPDPGGGYVFSAGSLNFGQSLLVDPKLRRLMYNVLCSGRLNANHPVKTAASGPRNRGECVSQGDTVDQKKSPWASLGAP